MLDQAIMARIKLAKQRVDYPPDTMFNVYQYSQKTGEVYLSDLQVPYKLAVFLGGPCPEFEAAGLYYWFEPVDPA